MLSWETCRQEFVPDGASRDICVLETSIEHWRKFFEILKSAYDPEYYVDGDVQPIPANVDEIFAVRSSAVPLVRFQVSSATVVCHFFCIEQIELDVDPRQVTSAEVFDGLTSLLKLFGDSLDKRMIMSYESDQQHPFIAYEPSRKEFVYYPCLITR